MEKENRDDLDAVREICKILESFKDPERKRIIRWAQEKLGMEIEISSTNKADSSVSERAIDRTNKSIKQFYQEKKPQNDIQFTVFVAYYYKFEAKDDEKKDEISSEILQDATRLVNRERLKKPTDNLHGAAKAGYLNNGSGRGLYAINTVGENLVAMTMPKVEKK